MAKTYAHGEMQRYLKAGCRCAKCRAGWAAYSKGYRARRAGGAASVSRDNRFENKTATPTSILLTPLGKSILVTATARTGMSAANVVERLLRDYGSLMMPEPAGGESAGA